MSIGHGAGRRRPRHARPSLLAPSRGLVGIVGLAVLAGTGLAVAAVLAGGPAGAVAHAAVPHAVAPRVEVLPGGNAQLDQAVLSPEDLAAPHDGGVDRTAIPRQDPATSVPEPRDFAPASALATSGIPTTALQAYQAAAAREARRTPDCGLSWPLLAGIGRVESDHGRFAGAVLHSDGLSTPRVIGIALNGNGTALIRDTDGGRLDGDTVYDRAVGPMQFIPSTWAGWGVDANHDGSKDPFNIFDAADAAADYLCAAGRDLTTLHGQVQAILSYNYSFDYVALVMSLERVYAHGVGISVPVLPTTPEPRHGRPVHKPHLPPVDPGKPRGSPPKSATPTPSPTGSTSTTPSPSPTYVRGSNPIPLPSSSTPSVTSSSSPTDTASPSSGAASPTESSSESSSSGEPSSSVSP